MAKIKIEIDTEATGGERILSGRVLTPPKIVLVSSISIPQTLRDAFTGGVNLNIPGPQISFKPSCGYGSDDLKTAIDNSADLIVTAGGNISYLAANAYAQKPFLSLTGAVPTGSVSSNYRGGVSLESWASNKDRITKLTGKGYSKKELGLFCNNNSAMHTDEAQDWKNQFSLAPKDNSQIFSGGNDAAGNNSAMFDFSMVSASIKALVISADPFFQDNKDPLIGAANNWITGAPAGTTRHVMYPLLDYRNFGGVNTPNANSSYHGHDLGVAYSLLGQLAIIALTPSSPVMTLRLPNIDL